MGGSRAGVVVAAFALCACGSDGPRVDPSHGGASGYYAIEVSAPDVPAAGVSAVRIGQNIGYDIEPLGESAFLVSVQGEPEPGAVDVVIDSSRGTAVLRGIFSYDAPRDPRFERFVALGASLSQGVQNGVPTQRSTLWSPPAQIARQLGSYFPLPLLIEEFLPEMTADDIGPPPGCAPPDVVAFVTTSAVKVLPTISAGFDGARIDADIEVHNLAVGGSTISSMMHGPAADDFGANFVSHLVFDPHGTGPVTVSQLELAEALAPTLVVMTDLFYNDVAAAVLADEIIDPSLITPIEEFRSDLIELFERLDATGAEIFVSNMPRPSTLPLTQEKRTVMIAGGASEPEADAAIAETDDLARQFNEVLAEEAAAYERVHVIDAAARIEELVTTGGIEVAGQQLTVQKFGGLLSFDGVHFTNTGYAMFANLFIDAINDALGTDVPAIDLADVIPTDIGSPEAIAASGLDVSQCER